MDGSAVYAQTNEAGRNRVLEFRRSEEGSLQSVGSYETGGAGDSVPHLTSQGSVILTGDGSALLVTNAGSDEVSVLAVGGDETRLIATVPSGGKAPKSVAEHDGLVYVLNTGTPGLAGFRLGEMGLEPLPGSARGLATGSDPAQVGFTPDGSGLVVTDRGTDSIAIYPVGADGLLEKSANVTPSAGPTPYGFAFAGEETLLVTEAFGAQTGKAAASSYRVSGLSATPVSRSVGNGRSEICWAVVSKDGRYVFTTNFADGAVSRYAIGSDGSIELDDAAAGSVGDGHKGLRDEALSGDGHFLYAIDTDAERIVGWAVGDEGRLDAVGSWGGVPATVAGLASS